MSTEAELLQAAPSAYRLYRPEFEITLDKKGGKAVAAWAVDAGELTPALRTIGGTVESIGGIGGTISRVVPLRLPEFSFMIAERVSARGKGHNKQDGPAGYYKFFELQVFFTTPDFDLDGSDAFLTITTAPSGRRMQIPTGAYVLGGGSETPQSGSKFVPGYTYNVMIHGLPWFNNTLYQSMAGTVNDATFRGAPAGTVLFHGPQATRTSTIAGVTTYQVGLSFEVSWIPWNKEVDSTGAVVDSVSVVGGEPWHPPADFTTLFPTMV